MSVRLSKKIPPKRITIVIDQKTEAKLREMQGQLISLEGKNFSFSKVINLLLLAGILQAPKLSCSEWFEIRSIMNKKSIALSKITSKDCVENFGLSDWR